MANGDSTPASNKLVFTLIGLLGTALGSAATSYVSTNEISTQVQVLNERVGNLQKQIVDGMDDRYRGSDAGKDHQLIAERDSAMKKLIEKNAKQIATLEEITRNHVSDHKVHN